MKNHLINIRDIFIINIYIYIFHIEKINILKLNIQV